jgi:Tfp pilus assembly protein PilF
MSLMSEIDEQYQNEINKLKGDKEQLQRELDAALDRAEMERDRAKAAERENEYLTHKMREARKFLYVIEKSGDVSAQKLVLDILDKLK